MTATVKLYALLAALVVASGVYIGWRSHERQVGALAVVNASLLNENKALSVRVASDSIALLKRDTALVFRNVVRQDTVLQRLIDTAIVHHRDTVIVTREVLVAAKAALDSTKGVADACCQLARDWKAKALVADSLYRGAVNATPGFWARRLALAVGYGAVATSGKIEVGPAIVAGFRVWP